MSLLPVEEALARVLAGIARPVAAESVAIAAAHGRTLAVDVAARCTQPPFAASAMDGYAVRAGDVAAVPARLAVIGRSVAGAGFSGAVGPMQAVRIFTGAPVPAGADAVAIQEDAEGADNDVIVRARVTPGKNIRAAGLDFRQGDMLIAAGHLLDARLVALAAAAGHAGLSVRRRPRVAILATGDELVAPGDPAGPDQIVASNPYAVAAIAARAGAEPLDLGIARDTPEALDLAIAQAREAGADMLVTLGGASVGEADLVQSALACHGMTLAFWRVALRPGKPLIHGRLGEMLILGLPGNPVSSVVCSILFVVPALRALVGDPRAADDPAEPAILGAGLAANDGRQDYLRARLDAAGEALPVATAFPVQDSSMLTTLARADALLVRAP
ncbi:MAG TPA: gephyrin-like molybdotransferase Glp, partial [Beijerinckiaceae bacterium]|nr:gephyrin-like molybdotransferase Glp [Beijerinckiaceae bacterium]